MKRLIAIMVLLFLAGCFGTYLCTPADAQQGVVFDDWVVVFTIKKDEITSPECRIYVMVRATSEGQAAIRAHKYLETKFAIKAVDDMVYQEAQIRKEDKK